MIFYLVVGVLALTFYRIGESEYVGKGWLIATISFIISIVSAIFTGWGIFAAAGGNILLFIGLTIYNMTSDRDPRSGSGF